MRISLVIVAAAAAVLVVLKMAMKDEKQCRYPSYGSLKFINNDRGMAHVCVTLFKVSGGWKEATLHPQHECAVVPPFELTPVLLAMAMRVLLA